jgi:hypothetical protein
MGRRNPSSPDIRVMGIVAGVCVGVIVEQDVFVRLGKEQAESFLRTSWPCFFGLEYMHFH